MPKQLESAQQAGPAALATPAPGADEQAEIDSLFESLFDKAPTQLNAGTAGEEAPQEEEEELPAEPQAASEFSAQLAPEEAQGDPLDPLANAQPVSDEDKDAIFAELTGSGSTQEEFPAVSQGSALSFYERLKGSFALTPEQEKLYFESLPGVTKVRKVGSNFLVTRGGITQKADPSELEFADLTADAGRLFLEMGIEAPFIIAGMAGGPLGMMGAGAAGAGIATNAADLFGALLDVPRDPDESVKKVLERTALAGALGATAEVLGMGVRKLVANHAFRKVAKDADFLTARQKNKQNLQVIEEVNEISKHADVGFTGPDGQRTKILVTELDVVNPQFRAGIDMLKKDPKYKLASEEIQQSLDTILDDALRAEIPTRGIKRTFQQMGSRDTSGASIKGAIKEAAEAEGKTIKAFKREAKDVFKTTPGPATHTLEELDTIMGALGLQSRPGEGIFIERLNRLTGRMETVPFNPTDATGVMEPSKVNNEVFASMLGLENTKSFQAFTRDLNDVVQILRNDDLKRGGFSPAVIEDLVDKMSSHFSDPALMKTKGVGLSINKLQSALRKDRREITKLALPENMHVRYDDAMNKFSELAGQLDVLPKAFETDFAVDQFIVGVFKGGSNKKKELMALKGVLKAHSPETWDKLQGQFFDELIRRSSTPEKGFSHSAFRDLAFSSKGQFGRTFMKEMFEGTPKEFQSQIGQITSRAARLERIAKGQPATENLAAQATAGLGAFLANMKYMGIALTVNVLDKVFKSQRSKRFLNQKFIDRMLNEVPKEARSELSKRLGIAVHVLSTGATTETLESAVLPMLAEDKKIRAMRAQP